MENQNEGNPNLNQDNENNKNNQTENKDLNPEQHDHTHTDVDLPTETVPSSEDNTIPEPKKVERKIKHPKTNVVYYDEPEIDTNWGWAIEFSNADQLPSIWEKLRNFLQNNTAPCKGTVSWLSLDPRGYFSARLRHFISFTGWGIQIQNLPEWFKNNISDLKKPIKVYEPSEELSEGNWQGYIVKEKITLNGPEFVKLDKFSRNKRKTVEEPKKPVSSKISRFWSQKPLYKARDYLIPVITNEKYQAGEFSAISYLEEYIVEQLEWKTADNNENEFIILPSDFTFDENATRKIKIPEEYTPEIEFDYPGMFPGMGGMGGMGGMPDFGDMPDMDDSELGDLESEETDNDLNDNEDDSSDSSNKDEAVDAEVVPDDK